MLVFTIFLLLILVDRPDQFVFSTYPEIYVKDMLVERPADKNEVNAGLSQLASKTNSIVVKRIIEPQEGRHGFVYQPYGSETLPSNFPPASEDNRVNSNVFSQYLIIQGTLSSEALSQYFDTLGYKAVVRPESNPFQLAANIVFSSNVRLSLLIFILAFLGLVLIHRVKQMRYAGIRLIAGEKLSSIMFKETLSDGKDILGASLLSIVISVMAFAYVNLLNIRLVAIVLSTVSLYAIILLGISAFLSLIYLISLNRVNLMSIIKGKVPLGRILATILLAQFLAILMVGWGINRASILTQNLDIQQTSMNKWDKQNEWFNLTMGLSYSQDSETQKAFKPQWEQFVIKEITDKDALLVQNNLLNFLLSDTDRDGTRLEDYAPLGNTLYVTPNYFDKQEIDFEQGIRERLAHLKQGEFGLILPETLKGEADKYKEIYQTYMSTLAKDNLDLDAQALFEVNGLVSFLPDNQERFLYNYTRVSPTQFLKDPIFVVVGPDSFIGTQGSNYFWSNAINYLYFKDFDVTMQELKNHDIYSYFSAVSNSRQAYYEFLKDVRDALISDIIGVLLGVFISILLFNSMNLLYFEQFRRDIFIKRISGMRFGEIHKLFLITQFMVFLVGFLLLVWLTSNITTSLLTLLIFGLNSILLLYYQIRLENKTAISVLKGK